ncbi:MAG: PIN domain-containing protein [Actinomycetota bacterium]
MSAPARSLGCEAGRPAPWPASRDVRRAGARDDPVEDYDLETARVHAALLADARRAGRPRGPHDLLIAATAIARRRTLVTFDRSEFEGIDGLDIRP